MNQYEELMDSLPGVMTNNSKEIVRQAAQRYRENPNDRNAKKLENYGLSVDHDDHFDRMGEWMESDFSKTNHEN